MNIFYLDKHSGLAAQALCDQHTVVMPKETAQILCSAHEPDTAPCKRTHYNHPCSVWARASKQNYLWLCQYGIYVAQEYTHRYGKTHKSSSVIMWCKQNIDKLDLLDKPFTEPPLCMPDQYWSDDTVASYRAYYIGEKSHFAKWNNGRHAPNWWPYKS